MSNIRKWNTPVPVSEAESLNLAKLDEATAVKTVRDSGKAACVERSFIDHPDPVFRSGWRIVCQLKDKKTVCRYVLYDKLGEPEECVSTEVLANSSYKAISRRREQRQESA